MFSKKDKALVRSQGHSQFNINVFFFVSFLSYMLHCSFLPPFELIYFIEADILNSFFK